MTKLFGGFREMTSTPYYKVTNKDGRACNGGYYRYSLPQHYPEVAGMPVVPGNWTEPIFEPVMCRSGYHVTADPMMWPNIGMRVFEVDVMGMSDDQVYSTVDPSKCVCESIRLVRECPDLVPDWWKAFERFHERLGIMISTNAQNDPDPGWIVTDTPEDGLRVIQEGHGVDWNDDAFFDLRIQYRRAFDRGINARQEARYSACAYMTTFTEAQGILTRDERDQCNSISRLIATIIIMDGYTENGVELEILTPDEVQRIRSWWNVWERGYAIVGEIGEQLVVYRRQPVTES